MVFCRSEKCQSVFYLFFMLWYRGFQIFITATTSSSWNTWAKLTEVFLQTVHYPIKYQRADYIICLNRCLAKLFTMLFANTEPYFLESLSFFFPLEIKMKWFWNSVCVLKPLQVGLKMLFDCLTETNCNIYSVARCYVPLLKWILTNKETPLSRKQ